MMGGLSSSLGLGVVLRWKDQMTSGVRTAERNLRGLKKTSDDVADKIVKDTERIRAQMDKARKGMQWSMGAMGVGAGVLGGVGLLAREAAKAEDRLQNIASLRVGPGFGTERVAKEMEKVKNQLADIAENTRIPTDQIDAAYYQIASALGDFDLAAVGADAAAKTAVAGMGTMAEATSLFTSALAIYGDQWEKTMSQTEMANQLFEQSTATVQKFNTTLPQISAGAAEVMGMMKNLGGSISEMFAGLGYAHTFGLAGGRGGTALKATLRQMIAQREALEEAGVTIFDKAGKFVGLGQVIKNLEVALDIKPGETLQGDQLGFIQKVFAEEGSQWLLPMLGRADEFVAKTEEIATSTNGARMVAERMKGAIALFERMTNAVSKLADEMGDNLLAPLKAVINAVWKAAKWLRQFALAHPDATKWAAWGTAATGALLLVGGAIGSVLFGLKMLHANMALVALTQQSGVALRHLGVLGKFLFWLGNTTPILKLRLAFVELGVAARRTLSGIVAGSGRAIAGLRGLTVTTAIAQAKTLLLAGVTKVAAAAQWAWNAAMSANPIGIVIVAVAALAAGVYWLVKNWQSVVAWVQKAAKWMFDTFRNGPIWARILLAPLMLIVGAVVGIVKALQWLWDKGKQVFNALWAFFKKVPGWVFMFMGPIGMIIGGVKMIADNWQLVQKVATSVIDAVSDKLTGWWAGIKKGWGEMKAAAEMAWNGIGIFIDNAIDKIFGKIKDMFGTIGRWAYKVLDAVGLGDDAKDLVEATGSAVGTIKKGMRDFEIWARSGTIKRDLKVGEIQGAHQLYYDAFKGATEGFRNELLTGAILSGQIPVVTHEMVWAKDTLGDKAKKFMALPAGVRDAFEKLSATAFGMSLDADFKLQWVKPSANAAREAAEQQQSAYEKAAKEMGFEVPTTMGSPTGEPSTDKAMPVNAYIGKTVAAGANQINVTALIEKIRPPMVEVPIVGILGEVLKAGLNIDKALNLPGARVKVIPSLQKANADARKLMDSPQIVQMIGVLSRIDATLPQLEMLIRPLLADLPTPPTLNIPTSVINPDVRLATLPAPHIPAESAVSPSDRPMPREWPPELGRQVEPSAPVESESQQESVRLLSKIARLMEIKEDKIEINVPPGDNGGNARELARQIAEELERKRLRGKDGRF